MSIGHNSHGEIICLKFMHLFFCYRILIQEKVMAPHSSTLAWKIPGTGSLVGCHLWGRTESDTTEATQQQQQHTYPSHFGSMLLKYHCHSERNLYQIKRLTNPNQISKEMALFLPSAQLLFFFFFFQFLLVLSANILMSSTRYMATSE